MAKPPSRRDSREDQDCCWYHGRISRDVAEDRLKFGEEKPQDGRFLVRDFCTVGDVSDKCDYVLSMTFGGEVQHYIIQQLCDDAFYSIDGGPVVHGLDALIEQYQLRRGGLPCCLQFRLPGMPPPAETRRHGRTNLLHRSTKEGNLEIIREVIQSGYHNLDAKNQDGQTVLHIAVNHGHLEALELLLSSGASPNIVDTKGFSPLHYACRRSENEMVVRLLNQGADPRLRSTYENLVPLHEAAQANNIECCKALLSRGCPKRPRNKDDELPEELAEKAGHSECAEIIRHSKIIWQSDFPPRDKWLHNDLTSREETREIFIEECSTPDSSPDEEDLGPEHDGAFLVRKSARLPTDWFVLCLLFDGQVRNFEVRREAGESSRSDMIYIDDGPLFESIEELVNHHMKWTDGLFCVLSRPIAPRLSAMMGNGVSNGTQEVGAFVEDDYELLTTCLTLSKPEKISPIPKTRGNVRPTAQKPDLVRPIPRLVTPSTDKNGNDTTLKTSSSSLSLNNGGDPALPKRSPTFRLLGSGLGCQSTAAAAAAAARVLLDCPETEPVFPRVGAVQQGSLSLGERIGRGQFGIVHAARWRAPNGAEYDVAVKILHVDDDDVDSPLINTEKEFLDEAKMMLGLDDHPHIIKIAGICRGSQLMMVQELARLGSLHDFLLTNKDRITGEHFRVWAAQVAKGMCFLEKNRYVHRDLACRNLLLKHDLLVKISDFGLSRALGRGEDIYTASNRGKWPVKWYAPENFSFAEFTIASDVWSFGIVLWEMHSLGATPYGEMSGAEINDMLERGDRLEKPARCPSDVYKIMENCWAYRPEDRPTFERLDRYFSCERYENLPSTTLLKNRAKLAKSPRKA